MQQLRKGDQVIVWKLNRLSRSLKDLLLTLEKIENTGADFRSITENIDTSTPAGRMMMQIVGSFAEFERAMLRERKEHRAGEKLFIDFCGPTVPIINPDTGEVRGVAIFVAVMGASNYTYVEACEG